MGGNALSLKAAALEARRQGYRPLVLTSRLEGEAREVARVLVSVLRECVATGRPAEPPVCLLAGGETTVTVRGNGRGGRNQEMAVAAAPALAGFPVPALFASLATDGIDGRSDAAGGFVDRETLGRAKALGLAPPEAFLARSDSRSFLGPVGGLIVTGPTGTNVMDLAILLADLRQGKRRGRRAEGPLLGPAPGPYNQASPWRAFPRRRKRPGGCGLHDDDPADGPEDPLAGLLRPPDKGRASAGVLDAGAAAFKQRAQLAEDRLAEVLNAYRALKTENEGFKERITKNLERRLDQRRERLLLKFIEILDNLDRALEATEQVYTGTPMIEGIILVRTQLLSVLKEEGLERIPVLGLPYDPNVAEAVETRPVAEAEHHHMVVKELLRGYRLNGRVARAARVAVGEHQPEAGAAADDEEPLVGADEVPAEDADPVAAEFRSLPPPPAEDAAVRGFDDALDELLEGPAEPVPEVRAPVPPQPGRPLRPPPGPRRRRPRSTCSRSWKRTTRRAAELRTDLEHVGQGEPDLGHHHHPVHVRPGRMVLGDGQLLRPPHQQVDGVDPVDDQEGGEGQQQGRVAGEDPPPHAERAGGRRAARRTAR